MPRLAACFCAFWRLAGEQTLRGWRDARAHAFGWQSRYFGPSAPPGPDLASRAIPHTQARILLPALFSGAEPARGSVPPSKWQSAAPHDEPPQENRNGIAAAG